MADTDDEAPSAAVERRFPKAGEISSGDATNAQSRRARLRYYGAEESNENPERRTAMAMRAPSTRLKDINP